MATKKRFIAGATCPKCDQVDTTYVLIDGENESRHCTRCDYAEVKPPEGENPAADKTVIGEWQPVTLASSTKLAEDQSKDQE